MSVNLRRWESNEWDHQRDYIDCVDYSLLRIDVVPTVMSSKRLTFGELCCGEVLRDHPIEIATSFNTNSTTTNREKRIQKKKSEEDTLLLLKIQVPSKMDITTTQKWMSNEESSKIV